MQFSVAQINLYLDVEQQLQSLVRGCSKLTSQEGKRVGRRVGGVVWGFVKMTKIPSLLFLFFFL